MRRTDVDAQARPASINQDSIQSAVTQLVRVPYYYRSIGRSLAALAHSRKKCRELQILTTRPMFLVFPSRASVALLRLPCPEQQGHSPLANLVGYADAVPSCEANNLVCCGLYYSTLNQLEARCFRRPQVPLSLDLSFEMQLCKMRKH